MHEDDLSDSEVLELHVGTSSPCWRLDSDSNALELAAVRGLANTGVALDSDQAAGIRRFTGVTSTIELDISLFGRPLKLHLVGRKLDTRNWAGTASAYTDTRAVARDLTHGLAFAELVVSEVNSLVVVLDSNGIIQRFNRLCEEVLGKREEDVIGRSAYELFMTPEQAEHSSKNITGFFENDEPFDVERYINTVNGPRLYQFRNKFVQSGSGVEQRFLICSGVDITEERNAQQRLTELANTDTLTGLPNRHAITELIRAALATGKNDASHQIGVLFLDLDNFKRVNDHYGHVAGDGLLTKVAAIVSGCLGQGATLARLGGDEFVVLSERVTLESLETTARTIIEQLSAAVRLDELVELYTSCSVGIALYPQHGDTVETLIRNADTAMYAAKEAGKHTYRVFTQEMNQKVARAMWLDINLRKALEEGQFVLHYQPLVDAATGDVRSVEALIRWQSPDRGIVGPGEFIRHAEESGLIGPIGRWVMSEAAKQAMIWKEKGLNLRVGINVSALQLADVNFVAHFRGVPGCIGPEGSLLDIELTESCLIENQDRVLTLMRQLREMGSKIYLDDFGTGYSSLAQLARLPLDVIKLDRSFVTGIDGDASAQELVRSVASLAKALGFSVVAEGVETKSQDAFIRQVGIECAQGYIHAKPMPAHDLEAWMLKRKKLRLIA
ncbi:cyclic di-GMP phosphodiesterase [Bordetella sp. FB-8]|uniref:cyclic di-GMP phosphodiesterase n=1 Tax=Bordetella sp. FB-8 TaxID=1159870 RepID=UPI000363B827|nr:cyclic di-GMP phosphodiesterase [Bordetella sp. FB-8]